MIRKNLFFRINLIINVWKKFRINWVLGNTGCQSEHSGACPKERAISINFFKNTDGKMAGN